MPFTPFHMGVALAIKPGINRYFSVLAFGLAQVAMDIEPGIGMLTHAPVLHGPTHTLLGALLIGLLVIALTPLIGRPIIRRWNREVRHYGLPWLAEPEQFLRTALACGALVGTFSHIALDALIHHDIEPLQPFSAANPLLGLMAHDAVYQLCAILGLVGACAWLWMKWRGRKLAAATAP